MYKLEFTKEEIEAAIIQIDARIDALTELQKEEGKKGNISRVLEIEKFMEPIKSFKQKLFDGRCRRG